MLLIHNISQLLTLAGGPQRGNTLGTLGIIPDAAVLIDEGNIKAVGSSLEIKNAFPKANAFDVQGHVVMPGFVDPHTHMVWAGDRANEFEMRLQGISYMEILAAGGGILSTVKATREADLPTLIAQTRQRAWQAFKYGTTTAEVKTGYGLDTLTELKQLEAIIDLDSQGPLELVPTFLGAHAIPPEFKDNAEGYTDSLCMDILPAILSWWIDHCPHQPMPFVDVFCEKGAFNLKQSRRILEKAKALGFPLKMHVDEFENLGGASLAAELRAVSADHLVKTSHQDIQNLAASDTVAVSLPGTPFGLAQKDYTPAKEIIAANGLLALATDLNPGTCWCESMQFIIALACRFMQLTPAQAIAASTINAAAAIQREDRIGSIEAGKQADLLVLDVDDYRQLGYRFGTNLVSYVVKLGKVYPTG
ncbi:MAG: imidazolonepropionase [Anaerolineaceae bacterium]|nr:imidazolonepropionase [Anaerolineaceae bacterium]